MGLVKVCLFTIVFWVGVVRAVWWVCKGPDFDNNDKSLGGYCYNILARLCVAIPTAFVCYFVFIFIFFLFTETLGLL